MNNRGHLRVGKRYKGGIDRMGGRANGQRSVPGTSATIKIRTGGSATFYLG